MLRFAPSPTGYIHLGNGRVALLNFLYAKFLGMDYVIRMDDTDPSRNIEYKDKDILKDLNWMYITYKDVIYQSKRSDIYNEALKSLKQVEYIDNQAVIFTDRSISQWNDMNFGAQSIEIPPYIILTRANQTFLYNFASAVDDVDLDTKLIIRGCDHLTNTATQLYLFKLLNPSYKCDFLHLPLMTDINGNPISKRTNDISIDHIRNHLMIDQNAVVSYLMSMNASYTYNKIGIDYTFDEVKNSISTTPPKLDLDKLSSIQKNIMQLYDYNTISNLSSISESTWNLIKTSVYKWKDLNDWEYILNDSFASFARKEIVGNFTDSDISKIIEVKKIVISNDDYIDKIMEMKKFSIGLRQILTGKKHGPSMRDLLSNLTKTQIIHRLDESVSFFESLRAN